MPRPSSGIAVGCLVLGLADVLYLDLVAAPAVLGEQPESMLASEDIPDMPEMGPLAAAKPASSPVDSPAQSGDGLAREARDLDPELSARTGAEPEPEAAAERVSPDSAAGGSATLEREPGARTGEPVAGPDALWSDAVHVHFGRDRATLGVRARSQLDRLARSLRVQPSLRASIDGHADRVGEPDHNDDLSHRRAERVADYFAARGVDRLRMTVRAFGEHRPLAAGIAPDANRRNRRVEIRVSRGEPD